MYVYIITDGIAVGSTNFNGHLAVVGPQIQCVEDTLQVQCVEDTPQVQCTEDAHSK